MLQRRRSPAEKTRIPPPTRDDAREPVLHRPVHHMTDFTALARDAAMTSKASSGTTAVTQAAGWLLKDPDESATDRGIIEGNWGRFGDGLGERVVREAGTKGTNDDTDSIVDKKASKDLVDNEAIHIEGHGNISNIAGAGTRRLSAGLRANWGEGSKAGQLTGKRKIFLHACETGKDVKDAGSYALRLGKRFADANKKAKAGIDVEIYAPIHITITDTKGLTRVAKSSVDESKIKSDLSSGGNLQNKIEGLTRPLGEGWVVVKVKGSSASESTADSGKVATELNKIKKGSSAPSEN